MPPKKSGKKPKKDGSVSHAKPKKSLRSYTLLLSGKKVKIVDFNYLSMELTTLDVHMALEHDGIQSGFLSIISLKGKKKGREFRFNEFGRLQDGETASLDPAEIYEISILDDREEDVQKLSDEDKAEIRKEFDEMDADGNGHISYKEAKAFYTKMEEEEAEDQRDYYEYKISKSEDEEQIQEYKKKIEELDQWIKFQLKHHLSDLESADVNSDKQIDWEEYLKHEARRRMALTKKNSLRKSGW